MRRHLRNRKDRRGIAILVVIAAIMILSAVVTDLSFGARVRFLAATHERDETEAYYIAMSGANVYRLILMGNKQISKNKTVCTLLSSLESPLSCQDLLVNLIPMLNTGLMRMMFVEDSLDDEDQEDIQAAAQGEVSDEVREKSMEETSHFGKKNFLDFDGDFMVEPEAQDCKINVNLLSKLQSGTTPDENFIVMELVGLMSGQENEQFLRDRSLTARELALNLLDWVDADSTVASGKGGYEDDFYNKLDTPYVAKNAAFDTAAEIRLVEGWGDDDVYEKFSEQLTVFGNSKGKVNVLCADEYVIKALLKTWCTNCGSMSETQLDGLLERYKQYISQAGVAVGSAKLWKKVYEDEAGVTWNSQIDNYITDKNVVYKLTSVGKVGDATAQITMVVDQSSSDFGKVIYWRVD